MHDAYRLGASLYVPAIHQKLKDALRGASYGRVRSLIACTEDSIAEADLERALTNLSRVLPQLPQREQGPLRFIRPRNAGVLAEILRMDGIQHVHGFVIPKADVDTLGPYEAVLGRHDYWLMPTLETSAVFDPLALRELRQRLTAPALKRNILALRIGGNDLLKMLGLRRTRGVSIYQTPLGLLIPQLVLAFRAFGIHLTAPVFDFIDDPQTLADEVRQDVQMGLIGKTAIHPDQVPVIEAGLAVTEHDLELARQILAPRREAVFRLHGAMIEKAIHQEWAYAILARAGSTSVAVAMEASG